jgi:hypothetical protein
VSAPEPVPSAFELPSAVVAVLQGLAKLSEKPPAKLSENTPAKRSEKIPRGEKYPGAFQGATNRWNMALQG